MTNSKMAAFLARKKQAITMEDPKTDIAEETMVTAAPEKEEKKEDLFAQFQKKAKEDLEKKIEESKAMSDDWSELIKYEIENPEFSAQDFIESAEQLRLEVLKASSADLPIHCKQILKNLQQYEELAHLLKPDQIGVIVNGLAKYTNITIVPVKKTSSSKERQRALEIAGDNLDDIL